MVPHPQRNSQGSLPFYLKLPFEIAFLVLASIIIFVNLIFRKLVPSPKKSIQNEIVLITGSSTGLGKEITLCLAKNHPGIKLVLWDINDEANRETAEQAKIFGARVFCYHVDVADQNAVEKTAKKVVKEVGDVTILYNNAGTIVPGNFLDLSKSAIESAIRVNFLGNCWTLKEFLPKMVENNHGHIITTCSGSSFTGMRFGSHYSASKFAVRGFLETLKSELRHHTTPTDNVKFTTVYPYFMDTNMTRQVVLNPKFNFYNIKLSPVECAAQIVDGMLRNQENVFIPESMEVHLLFACVVPRKVRAMLEDWLLQDSTYSKED